MNADRVLSDYASEKFCVFVSPHDDDLFFIRSEMNCLLVLTVFFTRDCAIFHVKSNRLFKLVLITLIAIEHDQLVFCSQGVDKYFRWDALSKHSLLLFSGSFCELD